ncbi:MAG: hypothetical protein ACO21T_09210 [Alphaproteobacteria bacterium]
MRLNPDFFEPGEEAVEFEELFPGSAKVISNLSELPDEGRQELEQIRTRINEILAHEEDTRPERDGAITYTAFQELQIMMLQQEIRQIHGMLLMLAKAVDTKIDRESGEEE